MLMPDQKMVKADFLKLQGAKCLPFPKEGGVVKAPEKQGVYIIYAPHTRRVVHVGRTYRGTAGLQQRLNNHLYGSSSFTTEYLDGHGRRLRGGYTFRFFPLRAWRRRALLENYATGVLCPAHLGKHRSKKPPQSK